jgi:hypothetical protein
MPSAAHKYLYSFSKILSDLWAADALVCPGECDKTQENGYNIRWQTWTAAIRICGTADFFNKLVY